MNSQKTILVVDDDPQIPTVLRTFLTGRGFHVVVARDGWAGVHGSLNASPDLILLDINMPVMDGMTTLTTIRQSWGGKNKKPPPRVLILSGEGERETVLRARAMKVDGFIAKPFDLKDLTRRVEHAIVKLDFAELKALVKQVDSADRELLTEPHITALPDAKRQVFMISHREITYHLAIETCVNRLKFTEKEAEKVYAFGFLSGAWRKAWPGENF